MVIKLKKKFYVTTAIPYVNAPPHIGFALEIIQTDCIARWHRLKQEDVFFLTGTDENSLKNVQAAEEEGISTRALVDKNAKKFISLGKILNVSFDEFIRTTEKRHFKGAQKLWNSCRKQDIYKKKYRGLYCVGCETFYTKKDLINGLCPEHKKKPEIVEEENYFFRLSSYQKKLKSLIEKNELKIIPKTRKNEVLSFINSGLEDFSISRTKERAKGWGVPVPNDKTQIVFVWFDALSNYINALNYINEGTQYKKFWKNNNNILHVIGKGITKFHAIYWPAMLLSAGLNLPKTVFIHGYLTVNGKKISKSLGNVIDPFIIVNKYGTDSLRYYLLREIPPTEDGDFSEKALKDRINNELANDIGNLLNRTVVMVNKYFKGKISKQKIELNVDIKKIDSCMDKLEFHNSLNEIWKFIQECNKYINDKKPWTLKGKELEKVLYNLVESLRVISILLSSFMPETSGKINEQLGVKAGTLKDCKFGLVKKYKVNKGAILFKKFKD